MRFRRENPKTPAKAGATKNNAAGIGVVTWVMETPSKRAKGGKLDPPLPPARKDNTSLALVAVNVNVSECQPEKPLLPIDRRAVV